jgi:hypothetical protein
MGEKTGSTSPDAATLSAGYDVILVTTYNFCVFLTESLAYWTGYLGAPFRRADFLFLT